MSDTFARDMPKVKPQEPELEKKPEPELTPTPEVPKQPTDAELSEKYVKLDNGQWVGKEYYNELPTQWQTKLKQVGIEGWDSYWKNKPYGGATEFIIAEGMGNYAGNKLIYGKTNQPLIGIDESGMRIYLGDRWNEEAIKYTGLPGTPPGYLLVQGELKPADVTLPSLLAQRDRDLKYIEPLASKYDIDISNIDKSNSIQIATIRQQVENQEALEKEFPQIQNSEQYKKLTPDEKNIIDTQGVEGWNKYADEQNKKYEIWKDATAKLEQYKQPDENGKTQYDIVSFIKDNPNKENILKDAGYTDEGIKTAKQYLNSLTEIAKSDQTLQKIFDGGGVKSLQDYLEVTTVKLKNGDVMNYKDYHVLPEVMQKEAMEKGVKSISLNPRDIEGWDSVKDIVTSQATSNAIESISLSGIADWLSKPAFASGVSPQSKDTINNIENEIFNRMEKFGLLKNPDGTPMDRNLIQLEGFEAIRKPQGFNELPYRLEKDINGFSTIVENRELLTDSNGQIVLTPKIGFKWDIMASNIGKQVLPPKEMLDSPKELYGWTESKVSDIIKANLPGQVVKGIEKEGDGDLGKGLSKMGLGIGTFIADTQLPYKMTAENAQNMHPSEIIGMVALDSAFTILTALGFGYVVSSGVRSGLTIPRAVARATIAEVKAPFHMIAHPVETIKAPFKALATLTGGWSGRVMGIESVEASLKGIPKLAGRGINDPAGFDPKIAARIGHGAEGSGLEAMNKIVTDLSSGKISTESQQGLAYILAKTSGAGKYIEPAIDHGTPAGEIIFRQVNNNKGILETADKIFASPVGSGAHIRGFSSSNSVVGLNDSHFIFGLGSRKISTLEDTIKTAVKPSQQQALIKELVEPADIEKFMNGLNAKNKLAGNFTPGTKQYQEVFEAELMIWDKNRQAPVPHPQGKMTTLKGVDLDTPESITLMAKREILMKEMLSLDEKLNESKNILEQWKIKGKIKSNAVEAEKLLEKAKKAGTPYTTSLNVDFIEATDPDTLKKIMVFHFANPEDISSGLIKPWSQSAIDSLRNLSWKAKYRDIFVPQWEAPKMGQKEQIIRIAAKIIGDNPTELSRINARRAGALVDGMENIGEIETEANAIKWDVSLPDKSIDASRKFAKDKGLIHYGSGSEYLRGVKVEPNDLEFMAKDTDKIAQEWVDLIKKTSGEDAKITQMSAVKGTNVVTSKGTIQISDLADHMIGGKKGVYDPLKSEIPMGWTIKTSKNSEGIKVFTLDSQMKTRLDNLLQPGIRGGKGGLGAEAAAKAWRLKDEAKFDAAWDTYIEAARKQAKGNITRLAQLDLADKQIKYGRGMSDTLPVINGSNAELAYNVTEDNVKQLIDGTKNKSKLPYYLAGGAASAGLAYALAEGNKDGNATPLQMMSAAALIIATKGKAGKAGKLIREETKITESETKALKSLTNINKDLGGFTKEGSRILQGYFNSARLSKALGSNSIVAAIEAIPRAERGLFELNKIWSDKTQISKLQTSEMQNKYPKQQSQYSQIQQEYMPRINQLQSKQQQNQQTIQQQSQQQVDQQRSITQQQIQQVSQQIPQQVQQQRTQQQDQQRQERQQQQDQQRQQRQQQTPQQRQQRVPQQRQQYIPQQQYRPKPEIPKPPRFIRIKTKNGIVKVTDKDLGSSLAWKQGLFYKLWINPNNNNQDDIISTIEPVPGVQYHKGIGSAARSLTVLHGQIPNSLHYDMGISDVDIFRREGNKKPIIKFTEDKKISRIRR